MMKYIKKHKFTAIIAAAAVVFFLWAQLSSFKLLKSEYGTKYAPNSNHGSVHHK